MIAEGTRDGRALIQLLAKSAGKHLPSMISKVACSEGWPTRTSGAQLHQPWSVHASLPSYNLQGQGLLVSFLLLLLLRVSLKKSSGRRIWAKLKLFGSVCHGLWLPCPSLVLALLLFTFGSTQWTPSTAGWSTKIASLKLFFALGRNLPLVPNSSSEEMLFIRITGGGLRVKLSNYHTHMATICIF